MAPKTLPPIAKQNLILAYIQKSLTTYNIKELEKTLPSVAGISGMQVKDYLQALSDEGKIRVEKIGSGNWYWSFLSEEKADRDNVLNDLMVEKEKVNKAVGALKAQVEAVNATEGEDEKDELMRINVGLEEEVQTLRKELEGYKDGDPGEVDRKRKEVAAFRFRAERWTDNIGILEGRLKLAVGGDAEQLQAIQMDVYGSEYVEWEGLKEL